MKCSRIVYHTRWLIFLACFGSRFLPAQTLSNSSPQPRSSVLASRVARLRHGINASEWFAQVYDKRGYTQEHFQNWTTRDDVALMKSMGFDHVRLSVNPQPMMADHRPDEIPADYL
jgi:endoglucanase